MISGALFICLVVGFSAGTPLRRQDGGYEYDVKHPGGNSRVHVRAGGERHRNSYPGDHVSDASYVNPHYVQPYYEQNTHYGQPHYEPSRHSNYPTSYNGLPPHGYNGRKVPVYEEHSRYPKPAGYQQIPPSVHNTYGIHPQQQVISQSHLDVGPFHEKPAVAVEPVYSSPQFVHQAAVDDSTLNLPPNKIGQIPLDHNPNYGVQKVEQIPTEPFVQQTSDLHEPEFPLKKDTPVIDQQVLVDEPEEIPVILQEPLDDKPVLSQVSVDIPPPKVIVVEPESPIVQQSSVDVLPPTSDVKYIDDDVVVQLPLDDKPSIKTVIEPPVVQQVADDAGDILHRSGDPVIQSTLDKYPSQATYDSGDIDDHPAPLYAAPPQYQFVPVGPPYEKISHSTEIIHGPPRGLHPHNYHPAPSTKSIAPPLPHQQEHIDVPLSPSVKLPPPPPPPVTKSVGPIEQAVFPHAQEIVEVPLAKNPPVYQSIKLPPPPPPVTKSVIQEHVEVPLSQSVKLPPPPPPVTKSLSPVIQQSVKLPPPPPITKSVVPAVSPPRQEPVDVILTEYPPAPHSVKLPPPVYKSPPLYKPVGGIKSPPYSKGPVVSYPPVSHSIKQPYARSYYVKTPYVSKPPLSYVPLTKSPVPYVPYSVKRPYAPPPLSYVPSRKSPVPYSVKRPYAPPPFTPNPNPHYGNPHVKSSYFKTPVTKTAPIPQGVKYPVLSNTHSVKHPKPVAAVKGYPSVKVPPPTPHLDQSSYVDEPLPEARPISHSVKHPHNTAPVLSHYDSPVGNPHLKHPPQSGAPVKKYYPVGHAPETSYPEPTEESDLPQEIPYPAEEISPLQKYPPVTHAFQILPVIPPPDLKSESSPSVSDDKILDAGASGTSPLDKYPRVSHSVRLPGLKPPTTSVPNLFAAVPPSDDDDASIESPLSEKEPVSHAIILPSPISEAKVSALRIDALSSPVSHPVRVGGRRNRVRYGEPKQDFPAFPAESAYGHPDPVSERVSHLSNSHRPRGGYANSPYEPDESESSNSPSVEEAKREVSRVNDEIGLTFGDRIPARSRLS